MNHLKVSIVCLVTVVIHKCLARSIDDDFLGPRYLTEETLEAAQHLVPDKCNTSFDAAGIINNNFVIFKDKYFWQPAKSNDTIEIRSVWPELPTSMSRIDAIYEAAEQETGKKVKSTRIWFFIGHEIYIFDGPKLELKLSLQDIGIDQKEHSKIDAIFLWPYNNETYIFSGEYYWKLNKAKVAKGYPRKIADVWHDSFNINSAFSNETTLYFLKDDFYHKFDPRCMQMNRMIRHKIAIGFLECPPPAPVIENRPRSLDVIHIDPEECEEAVYNIEKVSWGFDD